MSEKVRIAQIAPDVAVPGIHSQYTYSIPESLAVRVGDAVMVPFGSRIVVGYVFEISEVSESELGFDAKDLKAIQNVIEGFSLPADLMRALHFISREYLAPLGACVACAMPSGIRSRLTTVYRMAEKFPHGAPELSKAQREALEVFKTRGTITEKQLRSEEKINAGVLKQLIKKKFVEKVLTFLPESEERHRHYVLAEGKRVEEFLEREGERKPAQSACVLSLRISPRVPMTVGEIRACTGASEETVRKLILGGVLIPHAERDVVGKKSQKPIPLVPFKKLTAEQAVAWEQIRNAICEGGHKAFLLHGVTGSGKTELYLRAIAETLAKGRKAMYLVPEIALTVQIVESLRGRFGDAVAVMHSALSEGERLRNWKRIRGGEKPIVLGARSAVFAPIPDLGLIVVDEEHETTYKQDSIPRYHLREVAEFRAKDSSAVLILGSATPSIETYYRSCESEVSSDVLLKKGGLVRLTLTKRATDWKLPSVTITDLREIYQSGKPTILVQELVEGIAETLEKGEQTILFINRRAYATSLVCRDCGHQPQCRNCSVTLTHHRVGNRLECHHCGFRTRVPDVCPKCGGARLRPLGLGTQKVEEAVRMLFPEARIARLDRDVARRKGALETIFTQFAQGELQILVGTQMVAKGLDFPNVTLVGVIVADTDLSIPDFRATERTFQLLTQVAGRAGRHRPGKVIIQTFQPEHPAIRYAAEQDYKGFYFQEIEERKLANYPPFVRIVRVIASSGKPLQAERLIEQVAMSVVKREGVEVLGPAECAIGKLKGMYRRHLLLKLSAGISPYEVSLPEELFHHSEGQIVVDVDPVFLM